MEVLHAMALTLDRVGESQVYNQGMTCSVFCFGQGPWQLEWGQVRAGRHKGIVVSGMPQ